MASAGKHTALPSNRSHDHPGVFKHHLFSPPLFSPLAWALLSIVDRKDRIFNHQQIPPRERTPLSASTPLPHLQPPTHSDCLAGRPVGPSSVLTSQRRTGTGAAGTATSRAVTESRVRRLRGTPTAWRCSRRPCIAPHRRRRSTAPRRCGHHARLARRRRRPSLACARATSRRRTSLSSPTEEATRPPN